MSPDAPSPAVPRPTVRPPRPWSFPVPETTSLGNGVQVFTYPTPGQHVLSVRVAVPAPLDAEPAGREGVGALMARLLDEGSGEHDAEQMAELLERHGIAFGAGVVERGLLVEVDVPRRHLGRSLELLREMLWAPTFAPQQVRRHVRTRVAEIEQERANPSSRAAIAFVASYYDDLDRLSKPTGGTVESVESITPADLAAYHAAVARPDGSVVILAGDLDGLDATELLTDTFAPWAAADQADVAPAAPSAEPQLGRIVLVDRPGSTQSELYVGCPGPDRRDARDWAPYPVIGFVLGGGPTARLDAVLREERGYTYGMRCGFRPRRHGGLFLASGSVRADVTAEALGIALDVLDSGRDGFTEEEVRSGVDYLCETAPGRYATADAVADEAAARALDGLNTEHTTDTLRHMRELTPERLAESYRSFVDGRWLSVVVGDAASLEAPLAALGRGPVEVVPG